MQLFNFCKPDSSQVLSGCEPEIRAKKVPRRATAAKKTNICKKKMKSVSDFSFKFRLNN